MWSSLGREDPSARTSDERATVCRRTDTKGKWTVPGRFDSCVGTQSPGALREEVIVVRIARRERERTHGVQGQCPSTCSRPSREQQRYAVPTVFQCSQGRPLISSLSTAMTINNECRRSLPSTHQSSEGKSEDLGEFNDSDETTQLCWGLGRGFKTRLS